MTVNSAVIFDIKQKHIQLISVLVRAELKDAAIPSLIC
jgi:hypothetical protein